ncbi:MAG: hypothetical protein P1V97_31350, partial [Planctomycetota bacterium]|nr:hypothetical protein [Planctomycetota bacterium]
NNVIDGLKDREDGEGWDTFFASIEELDSRLLNPVHFLMGSLPEHTDFKYLSDFHLSKAGNVCSLNLIPRKFCDRDKRLP